MTLSADERARLRAERAAYDGDIAALLDAVEEAERERDTLRTAIANPPAERPAADLAVAQAEVLLLRAEVARLKATMDEQTQEMLRASRAYQAAMMTATDAQRVAAEATLAAHIAGYDNLHPADVIADLAKWKPSDDEDDK